MGEVRGYLIDVGCGLIDRSIDVSAIDDVMVKGRETYDG